MNRLEAEVIRRRIDYHVVFSNTRRNSLGLYEIQDSSRAHGPLSSLYWI